MAAREQVAKKLAQPSMGICIPVNIIINQSGGTRHTPLLPTTMKEAHNMTGRKANVKDTNRYA